MALLLSHGKAAPTVSGVLKKMAKKDKDIRICIWCSNEIEHAFTIPLCVPCLVRIHHETSDKSFDTNEILQNYLKEKRGKTEKS